LKFSRRKVGDIAKIHQFKARFSDKSGGGGAEPKKIALFSYRRAVQNNLQSIKTAAREPGLLDGMTCFRFFSDINVNLARESCAVGAVLKSPSSVRSITAVSRRCVSSLSVRDV
jgi:hypothetical protein